MRAKKKDGKLQHLESFQTTVLSETTFLQFVPLFYQIGWEHLNNPSLKIIQFHSLW